MKKRYPPVLNQLSYKLPPPPLFLQKKNSFPPIRAHLKIFIPPLLSGGGGGVVQTMDLYIETNIHPSILFSPLPHFKGTFAIFPQGFFMMTPVYENLEKHPPLLIHPLLQLSIKEYRTFW